MTTCPFLRRAEHCMGKVAEAPAEACRKTREKEKKNFDDSNPHEPTDQRTEKKTNDIKIPILIPPTLKPTHTTTSPHSHYSPISHYPSPCKILSYPIPSRPINHLIPSKKILPILSYPVPSHPISFRPISDHPVQSHLISSHLIPSNPIIPIPTSKL